MVGTLDSSLRVERISDDAQALFGRPLSEIIGQSLLVLMNEEDATTCLTAYAEASASQRGVTVHLNLRASSADRHTTPLACEVLILPLRPSPSCAFVMRPVGVQHRRLPDSEAMGWFLRRAGHASEPPSVAPEILRGVTDREIPGLGRLTVRELQIVARLLDGHRPPGIARALFLSQSTVRNHLASVFRKLGVTSQEGLLELFRSTQSHDGMLRNAAHRPRQAVPTM